MKILVPSLFALLPLLAWGCGESGSSTGATSAVTSASATSSTNTTSTTSAGGSGDGGSAGHQGQGGQGGFGGSAGVGGQGGLAGAGGQGGLGGSGGQGGFGGQGGMAASTSVATSSASGPMPCNVGDNCGAGMYCDAPGCGAGTCVPKPGLANVYPDEVPACGCDNGTYWNASVAAYAGVAVAADGVCAQPIDCDGAVTCPGTLKCRRTVADQAACMGATPGTCWGLPLFCGNEGAKGKACSDGACATACALTQGNNPWWDDGTCP